MTSTGVEDRLTEQLTELASYAADAPSRELSDTPSAPVTEARRPRIPVWAVAASLVVVIGGSAFAVAALVGDDNGSTRAHTTAPANDPAVHQLTIDAHNFFLGDESGTQTFNFSVPAGPTRITLVSLDGNHTLAFADPEFSSVHLAVPDGPASAVVTLVEGHVYTIYCELPGHRGQGMEATISVGPAAAQAK